MRCRYIVGILGFVVAGLMCHVAYAQNAVQGVTTAPAEAPSVDSLRKAAEQGDATAQNNLGDCYRTGKGVEQDQREAVKWYRKAAEQGLAHAQDNLGVCYYTGTGVEKDEVEAVKWYRKSAEQGDRLGQYNLGLSYDNGNGVGQDQREAVKWFRRAAEQGDADAENTLGAHYFDGTGVEQDQGESAMWYRKSAEQSNATAQLNLGACYYKGTGVKQDQGEAINWFRKAAEQGNAGAQFNLGVSYYKGTGVKQDQDEAVKWLRKAAEQGYANAENALKTIGQKTYRVLGGGVAVVNGKTKAFMLIWGKPFPAGSLKVTGKLNRPSLEIKILDYDKEKKLFEPTDDSPVPTSEPEPGKPTEYLTQAINVVWLFTKAGIAFDTDDGTYVSETNGATIAFTESGVDMKGIKKQQQTKP
jgi:TPR repeat protein